MTEPDYHERHQTMEMMEARIAELEAGLAHWRKLYIRTDDKHLKLEAALHLLGAQAHDQADQILALQAERDRLKAAEEMTGSSRKAAARIAELEADNARLNARAEKLAELEYDDSVETLRKCGERRRAAVLTEREACANLVEDYGCQIIPDQIQDTVFKLSAEIRARPAP